MAEGKDDGQAPSKPSDGSRGAHRSTPEYQKDIEAEVDAINDAASNDTAPPTNERRKRARLRFTWPQSDDDDARQWLSSSNKRREDEEHAARMAQMGVDVDDARNNIKLRKRYARKAHRLAVASLCIWLIVLTSQIVESILSNGKVEVLDDSVLVAVTTGCTVNVLAAFVAVVKGLFPGRRFLSQPATKAVPPQPDVSQRKR